MGNIICIIDGMTDEDFCIENYENLSDAKQKYAYGNFLTVPNGLKTESLNCILSLLGLPDNEVAQFSRGWVEAVGAGIDFDINDLVLRTTCVELNSNGEICGTREMDKSTQQDFYKIGSYQGVFVLKNKASMVNEIRCFAPYENPNAGIEEIMPQGDDELLAFAKKNKTQKSAIVPWGQSAWNKVSTSYPNATMVAGATITKGIAHALNMRCVTPSKATGDINTDLNEKLSATLLAARISDFVCIHINGADEAAHRLDAKNKTRFLRQVDHELVKPLVQSGNSVLICADHGTSPKNGAHINMPQPFVLVREKVKGNIGTQKATDALMILKGLK